MPLVKKKKKRVTGNLLPELFDLSQKSVRALS